MLEMVNYSNSIIYKLCCRDVNINDVYVGSTTNFNRRKQQHKHSCNSINSKDYNVNVYQFIRDNGGFENWDMVEIVKYNATDKRELHKRERYYIDTLKATLNKIIPTRTHKEYRENNKDIIRKNNKEYRENNKDLIREKKKQYRENNKNIIREKEKQYRENNKDLLREKPSQKYECECGGKYTHSHESRHLKTKKHLAYLEKQIQH